MPKVDFHVRSRVINGVPKLEILGEEYLAQEVALKFKSWKSEDGLVLDGSIFNQKKLFKTNPMLGYLYGHLAKVAMDYLRNDCGWISIHSKEQAVDFFKPQLGFVEVFMNEVTGETEEVILSIASADRERIADFIQELFQFLIASGCKVLSPDEYKINRNG